MLSNGDGVLDFIYQQRLMRDIDPLEAEVRRLTPENCARLRKNDDHPVTLKARFTTYFPEGYTIDIVDQANRPWIRTTRPV